MNVRQQEYYIGVAIAAKFAMFHPAVRIEKGHMAGASDVHVYLFTLDEAHKPGGKPFAEFDSTEHTARLEEPEYLPVIANTIARHIAQTTAEALTPTRS